MKTLPEGSITAAISNMDRRNQAIRDEYQRAQARGTRSAFIIIDLAYRFYLTESTIQSIVWGRGRYRATEGQSTSTALAA